jgi:predicted DNA-binding transcriptional regulator AlpA
MPVSVDEDIVLLSVPDTLALLPFRRPTLYRKIRSGEFPQPGRFGGRVFFSKKEVQDYIRRVFNNRPSRSAKIMADNEDLFG